MAPAMAPAANDPGGLEVPVYATRLPPAANLRYLMQRGAASGPAELRWQPQQGHYALALHGTLPGRPPLAWASAGEIDAHGVAPERYVESRRGREQRAANFQRASGRITFSGPQVEVTLVAGAQDRLSWLLQLSGVLAADPALAAPGQQITLFVVGARGDAQRWVFDVVGSEDVGLPEGLAHALLLRREPERAYDTRAEVWLDPARRHLPVRVRWQAPPSTEVTELSLQAIDTP